MKRIYPALALLLSLLTLSCRDSLEDSPGGTTAQVSPMQGAVPGIIRIKVAPQMRDRILSCTGTEGNIDIVAARSSESLFDKIGIQSLTPVFPSDPRFVERERRAGLDRWFDVTFSTDRIPMTRAVAEAASYEGVEIVDFIYPISPVSVPDDPELSSQWHYQNDGSLPNSRAGSDINLLTAYGEYGIYGDPSVIVAVIDGGIDVSHPDLSRNIWVNEAEKNGESGKDDDGNGYKDDVNGYNFMYKGALTPHDHGTHVAGTVGAVSNNSVGVAGIAGGDGTPESGVRLMSCQIFDHRDDDSSGDCAPAFKYAADNGAVIAQCSFSYNKEIGNTMPAATKAAIDYFIENAGVGPDGTQTGPMKGGVVIFAAGNDNTNTGSPAYYDAVLAVASVGADYERAYYSNYGSWVDIAAPGGDAEKGRQVLSTLPDGKYGYMQGTSMACPHVSGIAALVVSALGGDGFTNEDLKTALIEACVPDEMYSHNPDYTGQLGIGLIDASLALVSVNTVPPEPVTDVRSTGEPSSNTVGFDVRIPKDDTGDAYYLYVYYGKEPFSQTEPLPEGVSMQRFVFTQLEDAGEDGALRRVEIAGLEFKTTYHFGFVAADRAKNMSALSELVQVTTGENHAPQMELDPADADFEIKSFESRQIRVPVSDPDGHALDARLDGAKGNPDISLVNGAVSFRISGRDYGVGDFKVTLVVFDEYGMETSSEISFTVLESQAPVVVKTPEGLCISGLKMKKRINMNEYIADPDLEALTFAISAEPEGIVSFSESSGYVDFVSQNYGTAQVTVVGTDSSEKSASVSFQIIVRPDNDVADLYPNPVEDFLNIRPGDDAVLDVRISDAVGAVVFSGSSQAGPFSPFRVDMSACPRGVYYVEVSDGSGSVLKTSVIKK